MRSPLVSRPPRAGGGRARPRRSAGAIAVERGETSGSGSQGHRGSGSRRPEAVTSPAVRVVALAPRLPWSFMSAAPCLWVKGAAAMNETTYLPHHRLIAYGVARELVLAVVSARIRDSKLRDRALRAAL